MAIDIKNLFGKHTRTVRNAMLLILGIGVFGVSIPIVAQYLWIVGAIAVYLAVMGFMKKS